MNNNIKEIAFNGMRWIDIKYPGREEINYLRTTFNVHPLDLEDILAPTQRSKIDKYPNYIFFILLFPVYNRKTREIESSELDIFFNDDYVITIHRGDLPPLIDLFQLCQLSDQARENIFRNSTQLMLYDILNKLFLYCYPILDHISLDIQNIKKQIFAGNEKRMVAEILIIRRNITDLRKIMQSHNATLQRLMKNSLEHESKTYRIKKELADYYDNLLEYSQEIWGQLETFKEVIEALQQTNESLISFKLNNVMKVLTLISVIMLPATFVASLFGVNAEHMPFVGMPHDFTLIALVTFLAAIIMMIFIWRRRWF
ncbi:MAG: magnesium transporter CorA family protein [Patescibacteria group bacterium]